MTYFMYGSVLIGMVLAIAAHADVKQLKQRVASLEARQTDL